MLFACLTLRVSFRAARSAAALDTTRNLYAAMRFLAPLLGARNDSRDAVQIRVLAVESSEGNKRYFAGTRSVSQTPLAGR